MPNNNKIAISRGYAIKTADLSIYNRGQSEFVVEKNTVVVSSKSDMSKINYYGTMNFHDDRPISPRVNRTTLAGGIITNGLRSGATVPANTPSINKSRDYILTNRSNTAMRDGEYNFTTGKFNSDFPQVVVDRPALDATLFGSAITIFLAGTALLANTDNAGDGEGGDGLGEGGDDGGGEKPLDENGGDVDPEDPNGDGSSRDKCSEQESPSSPHNDNAGCCKQYTRTKPIDVPHYPNDVEVWDIDCYRKADCSECPNPQNLEGNGECEILVRFFPSMNYADLNHFLEYLWIIKGIKRKNNGIAPGKGPAAEFLRQFSYTYKFPCNNKASCVDSLPNNAKFSLKSNTPPYGDIIWPTVAERGYNPSSLFVLRKWYPTFRKVPTGTDLDKYQTYNVWSLGDCNGDGDCTPSPSVSLDAFLCDCKTQSAAFREAECRMVFPNVGSLYPQGTIDRAKCMDCIGIQDAWVDTFNNTFQARVLELAQLMQNMTPEERLDWRTRCEEDWVESRPDDCGLPVLPYWGNEEGVCPQGE